MAEFVLHNAAPGRLAFAAVYVGKRHCWLVWVNYAASLALADGRGFLSIRKRDPDLARIAGVVLEIEIKCTRYVVPASPFLDVVAHPAPLGVGIAVQKNHANKIAAGWA